MPTLVKTRKRAPQKEWATFRAGGLQILQAQPLSRIPGLLHGFSTRGGGRSQLDRERVLNLGAVEWDTAEGLAANRRQFLAALAAKAGANELPLVTLKQIHSDAIHVVAQPVPGDRLPGDALITASPGLLLGVHTADCLPILLADAKRRVAAAVHAGWRGTLKRIVSKTLGRMRMEFGTPAADVRAALGPGIGPCCYEVGLEVVQQFHAQFANAREWFDGPFDRLVAHDSPNPLQWLNRMPPGHQPPPPTAQLDLAAANCWQLLEAGLSRRRIEASPLCTACRTDLLFSHRRERGLTGRMLAVIGWPV